MPITDDSLQHLEGLKDLEDLNLTKTQVTEQGLAHLKDLPKLKEVVVGFTGISDQARMDFNTSRTAGQTQVKFTETAR